MRWCGCGLEMNDTRGSFFVRPETSLWENDGVELRVKLIIRNKHVETRTISSTRSKGDYQEHKISKKKVLYADVVTFLLKVYSNGSLTSKCLWRKLRSIPPIIFIKSVH